jgi:DNA-directed RNA polymerase II subunit RPB1
MAQSKQNTTPSRIIGLQFSILSPEEIRKSSVANIVSRDTYVNNKPVIGGLFDPRMGVLDPGLICPTDGLNYMDTPGYFGHIEMARPIFYIQYIHTIVKILRCVCIKCSKLLIDKKKYEYLLSLNSKKRWDKIFKLASKISRCGDETCDGCGTKQPRKIMKEGLATLIAEWDNIEGIENSEGANKDKLTMRLTPEITLKIFRRISDEDVEFMGFSALWSRPDWMICQVLAVPPPAVRPSVKHDAQQRSEDDISHIIVNIVKANKTLQEKIQNNATAKVIEDWTMVLQYYVATMVDNKIPGVASVAQRSGRPLKSIKERLVGKPGRVRGNLMGKRVDYSARSVITPDANIGISELGIPLKVAKNITFPEVVNKRNKSFLTQLMLNGPNEYPGAKILERKAGDSISLRYVDRNSIELQLGDIVHRHMLDGDPVLFNRQPTLHRMSMMCHFAKIMKKGATFRLNVADTKPYNADFDGDEMNLHGPQDYESAAELTNLAAVARQIISPANNSPIIGIFQDSLLGSFRFTRENTDFDTRTAMNLLMAFDKLNPKLFKKPSSRISSFQLLTEIMPPMSAHFLNGQFDDTEDRKTSNNVIEIVNGKFVRGQLDKAALGKGSKGLLHSICNDFGYADSADFIDNLQNLITEYMKISSYSVGISDLIADTETNNKISDAMVKRKKEVKNLIDQTHIGTFENTTGKTNEIEFESKVNSILQKAADEAGKIGRKSLTADNRFVIMVNAGSKGNSLNIAQMVSCLGQQNVDGKRIPYGFQDRTLPHYTKYNDSPEARGFVESSFIQGLTPTELYFHAMGGRTGLIDTAVKTSTTGYIQRRLIKGLEDLRVVYDMTVRNNKNKIIQFAYGDDNIDPTKVENQNLQLATATREEIYAHFQMPLDDSSDAIVTTNYTKAAIKRIKKQKDNLVTKTHEMITYMIESREKIVQHVFKFIDETQINIPVHFRRIINNIHNQLSIQSNSLVNITPTELYELLDETYSKLMKNYYAQPTELFKIAYYYYLSPKTLLTVKRFNKKAIIILLETIVTNYQKAIIHPGEMVGMIAAQSIGEPTTQMTLNTFHFAGVASKSNATRGVPRVEEILTLSENPKKPSVTIHLKESDRDNIEKAQELKYTLEYTCLRDVVDSVSICFDPDEMVTLIEEDKPLLAEYNAFQNLIKECQGDAFKDDAPDAKSKWIIRIELNKEAMLDKHISMDDIHFAVANSYSKNISCVYADLNSDKLVFRIRLTESNTSSKKKSLDQSDEIYKLKNFQNNLLNNIILRGIKNIPKVLLRKIVNNVVVENTNYVQKDGWVLDTIGTNLRDILALSSIDKHKTTSNDIREIFRTLGVEAARQSIFNELSEAMDHAGIYINYHHLSILCDRMAATCKMVSIFRHGINNDDIGPIAKASFEETPEMFLRAARHAELDLMTGVSSNVMCGQEGYFGTGCFQVMLDINKMKGNKILEKDIDIQALMQAENAGDACSIQNIQISNTVAFIGDKDTGIVDDEYDPGF